jgi:5-methylcytosine-specific restriction endonuclease McrBC regulatory subunit McrC
VTTLIKLREFERRSRREFPSEALARLERFDRALTDSARSTVLDWSLADDIRATSWVGVLQVPGLSIEILPKLESTGAANDDQSTRALSRRNLLYMLVDGFSKPRDSGFAALLK